MKCLKILFLIFVSSLVAACSDSKIHSELVDLYVGKTVPYSEYSTIGQPETLTGTNNSQWVAYFPKANFTIVTNKQTDIVKTVFIGKHKF